MSKYVNLISEKLCKINIKTKFEKKIAIRKVNQSVNNEKLTVIFLIYKATKLTTK